MRARFRHRADENQSSIVSALRKQGCAVYVIGRPLDLLIYSPIRKRYYLADVKNPKGSKLTEAQKEFMAKWPGPWYTLETVEDALSLVGVM